MESKTSESVAMRLEIPRRWDDVVPNDLENFSGEIYARRSILHPATEAIHLWCRGRVWVADYTPTSDAT